MLICITENMNQNIAESHVLLRKILKQQLKFVVYQKKICGLLFQVPITPLPLLPKLRV
jgi:hypothetical protein